MFIMDDFGDEVEAYKTFGDLKRWVGSTAAYGFLAAICPLSHIQDV